MAGKLNLDVASAISDFEALMREFLIKKIIYKIIFRGKGLEFETYRDFAPDDDASDIDWKASTRANKLLVKQYIEERDLKIMFIVDVSDNMVFGSTEKLKCEYAVEVCAALAHLIITSGDKIGFVLFDNEIKKIVLPQIGMNQFHLFVSDLSNASIYGGTPEINKTLNFLLDYFDESISAVIIVSDFFRMKKDILKTLNLISNKFETMAIMIKDPLDKTLPKIKGEVIIQDSLTGEQMLIDPTIARKTYEKNALEQEKIIKKIFTECNIDFLELTTDKPFPLPLAEFLKERVEKRKFIIPS